jgi:hypothetical protein
MVVDLARPKFTSDKWGKKLQNGKCTIRIPKDATEASVMFAKNNVAKEVVLFPVLSGNAAEAVLGRIGHSKRADDQ